MGDKIDFNAALEDCKSVRDSIKSDEDFQNADFGLVMYYLHTIIQALEIATTVKRGKWKREYGEYDNYVLCSECGLSLSVSDYIDEEWREILLFCPSCGADMRGDVDVAQS